MIDLARGRRPSIAALFLLFAARTAYAQPAGPLPPLPPLPAPESAPLPATPPGPAPAPAYAPAPVFAPAPAASDPANAPEFAPGAEPESAPSPGPASAPAPAAAVPPDDAPDVPRDNGCPGRTRVHCHDRLYLRAALGVGVTALSGTGPVTSASVTGIGLPARIAVGGTVGKGIAIGGSIFGVGTSFGRSASNLGTVKGELDGAAFFMDWFPRPAGGWHVGGEVGLGVVGISASGRDSGIDVLASAFGGYDWWIDDQWSVGALLVGTLGSNASLTDKSYVDTGYRLAPATIGILGSVLLH
jgi:hypothetical protein